ncbi:MAG: GtrA family protein [Sphingomonadaceae bacterium]
MREFAAVLHARRAGQSKLDRAVAFEFLIGLYERTFGQLIPTRFALFGTVGALGVGVHMAALALLYVLAGSGFALAQALATFIAMSFNFWLNNWLTYRDQRLTGGRRCAEGLGAGFAPPVPWARSPMSRSQHWRQARGVHWRWRRWRAL